MAVVGHRNVNRQQESAAGKTPVEKDDYALRAWLFQYIHKVGEEINSYEFELK